MRVTSSQSGIGRHHAPRREVVERGAPQHGFLAAGVHRDVAADARRVGRRRIDREDEPVASAASITRLVTTPAPASIVGVGAVAPGSTTRSIAERRSSFSVLMTAERAIERHRAAGVARAAAARNDGEPELDAPAHQARHLGFRVRMEHDERIFDAPVGGVGDVRYARQAVEGDVVAVRMRAKVRAARAGAAPRSRETRPRTRRRRRARASSSVADLGVEFDVGVGTPALLDLAQTVAQRVDQQFAPLRIVEQIVLQVRIALDDPDVAQHFEEHARRAPRAPLATQLPRADATCRSPSSRITISRSENDV